MADFEVFLDEQPGETRGVVAVGGRYRHLIIHREDERPEHRLGARLVGRVVRVEAGLRGAFLDLGCGEPFGFLPLGRNDRPDVGAKLEAEVSAEPREAKGPVLRRIGAGEGAPRLLSAGPSVAEILGALAPGRQPVRGVEAVRASLEAEEEASSVVHLRPEIGLNLAVERTRALIAADIDYAPPPGRDSRRLREAVNREGLAETARLLALKSWGGLVAIDLAGVNLHAESVVAAARQAFAILPGAAVGPLSRFGLLQVSAPWGRTPVDERLARAESRPLDAVRRLRLALLTNTAAPRVVLTCSDRWRPFLAPLVERLGPRAVLNPEAGGDVFLLKEV